MVFGRRGSCYFADAIMHGMPPHIAQLVAGHGDIGVTLGYKAVYPEEVINAHRAFITRRRALRPAGAVGRSILIIVWHLLSDPDARYTDLGAGFFDQRINPERRKRAHVHQLEALGYKVTLEPAA
jgi:hypothetical protein